MRRFVLQRSRVLPKLIFLAPNIWHDIFRRVWTLLGRPDNSLRWCGGRAAERSKCQDIRRWYVYSATDLELKQSLQLRVNSHAGYVQVLLEPEVPPCVTLVLPSIFFLCR